jgi:hypothetical protein
MVPVPNTGRPEQGCAPGWQWECNGRPGGVPTNPPYQVAFKADNWVYFGDTHTPTSMEQFRGQAVGPLTGR